MDMNAYLLELMFIFLNIALGSLTMTNKVIRQNRGVVRICLMNQDI